MAIPHSELQSLNPSAILELFVLELVEGLHYATGNPDSVPTTFRFHSGCNMNSNGEIVWQSNSYQRLPIEARGFAYTGKGQTPRPQLTISNFGGITRSGSVIDVSGFLNIINQTTAHNDLLNAKLTRLQVLASSLDNANFSSGSNPFGTPNSDELPQEIYFIERKTIENRLVVQFELVGRLDVENKKLPARQVTRADFPAVGTFVT
jgi:lambda family phage minor tail protein L|tara:strand:+ start:688 stop:1305 length:618 start_codon:yes stop_codon:yes gene_type:complete